MKMTYKKRLTILIIGIAILLVAIGIITYAFFSGNMNLTNAGFSAGTNASELDYYFEASDDSDILLNLTLENMQSPRIGNVAASDNMNINITFTSGQEDREMYCTYDLVWVWDTTDVVKNRYIKTTGAELEYTVSGTNGTQSFSEKQVNNYGTDTVLHTGYITSSSLTDTEQTWQINTNFYNTVQNQNALVGAMFRSKVKVENVNCEIRQLARSTMLGGFNEMILADNQGRTVIEAKGSPVFSTISPTDGGTSGITYEISSRGMYAAQDDFGTSYYYRGNVENNWVKLDGATSDMYFRIIRINGDGTVRMIYTGTTAPTEAQKAVMTGTGTQIETKAYNSPRNTFFFTTVLPKMTAENVGYSYTLGEVHGTSTASIIKGADSNPTSGTVDKWYIDNILTNSKYVNVISQEQVLCNDRTAYTDAAGTTLGGGTGNTIETYYAPYVRLSTNKTPTLECANTSDEFTVAGASTGNKTLQYPVGLITADEVAMAGGVFGSTNYSYYLYTGQDYWTASPAHAYNVSSTPFMSGGYSALVFYVYSNGHLINNSVFSDYGVRPVVSLKSDIEVTGTGQWNDPYVVDGT